ncbi:hypothetical protein CC80DRAFT_514599 [Byssothecium circinans]|uniref:Cytochrome c oxidase assembly protein COX16, mitochondrial n=1 Tax=Byssothecium circinans TaxID=147558 RepID=A0A6A5U695_9PLEO|nr:hypothetical protein CC80DRAFT_514599 [Byssothecium circinans]
MRRTPPLHAPFASKSFASTLPNSHPFLLFGLPFLATIVAGSFLLTPATALRYKRYDRKNQQITQEEAMGLGKERRKVNMKDKYYVTKDLENWEQRRVKRLPGEIDGVLE